MNKTKRSRTHRLFVCRMQPRRRVAKPNSSLHVHKLLSVGQVLMLQAYPLAMEVEAAPMMLAVSAAAMTGLRSKTC